MIRTQHQRRSASRSGQPSETRRPGRRVEVLAWRKLRRWSRRSGARPIGAMVAASASTRARPLRSIARTPTSIVPPARTRRSSRRRGIAAGDVAVLAFDPGLDFIRSVFAALYAGIGDRARSDRRGSRSPRHLRSAAGDPARLREPPDPHRRPGLGSTAGCRPRGLSDHADVRRPRCRARCVMGRFVATAPDRRRIARHPAVHIRLDGPAQGRDHHAWQPRRESAGHHVGDPHAQRGLAGGMASALPRHGSHRGAPESGLSGARADSHHAGPVPSATGFLAAPDHRPSGDPHRRPGLRLQPLLATRHGRAARPTRPVEPETRDHGSRAGSRRDAVSLRRPVRSGRVPSIRLQPGLRHGRDDAAGHRARIGSRGAASFAWMPRPSRPGASPRRCTGVRWRPFRADPPPPGTSW